MTDKCISPETWKLLPETAGKYEVSTHGRVRSLARGNPRILKTTLIAGYPSVTIYYEEGRKSMAVHQLMGDVFLERNYWMGTDREVNHKDGNKQNNNIDNLEIVTHKENSQHAHRNGLASTPIISKLSEEQVRDIHRRIQAGVVQRRLAEEYNVSPSLITQIKQGDCWPHIHREHALNEHGGDDDE